MAVFHGYLIPDITEIRLLRFLEGRVEAGEFEVRDAVKGLVQDGDQRRRNKFKELEARGFVRSNPDTHIYSITDKGRQALEFYAAAEVFLKSLNKLYSRPR